MVSVKRIGFNMLAIFALLVGAIPGSALAALCRAKPCEMACCTHAPVSPVAKAPTCHKAHCQMNAATHPAITLASVNHCKCALASSPAPQTDPILASSVTVPAASIPETLNIASVKPIVHRFVPSVYANDSGPPDEIRSRPWIGRAPPIG